MADGPLTISEALERIRPLDLDAKSRAEARQATLTKPPGSLGRLEGEVRSLGARLSSVEQRLDRVIFTMFGFGAALVAGMVGILVKLFV